MEKLMRLEKELEMDREEAEHYMKVDRYWELVLKDELSLAEQAEIRGLRDDVLLGNS